MNKTKSGFLYATYIVAVAVFFLYYLFPSDTVKSYLSYVFSTVNPNLQIKIKDLNLSFPPGLCLKNTDVYYLDINLFHFKKLKLTPGMISLFSSEKTFYFKGDAYEGVFIGNLKIIMKARKKGARIEGKTSNLNIKKVSVIQNMTGRKVTGVLDGKFRCTLNKRAGVSLGAELLMSNCTIEILNPLLKIDQLNIKTIEAIINMTNNKFRIKQCDIKGYELNGNLSGTLLLTDPVGKSSLNLAGKIRPDPVFLARLKKDIPAGLLPKKFSNKKGVFVRFTGTLNNPSYSF